MRSTPGGPRPSPPSDSAARGWRGGRSRSRATAPCAAPRRGPRGLAAAARRWERPLRVSVAGCDDAPMEPVRVDRWLWAARLVKTRALAVEAISGGRVHLNGQRIKPSRAVQPGDELE